MAYRETITAKAAAEGRHVRQSGGHGQYGVVNLEVEPTPRGEGFVFVDKVVGGVVPRQFIPAVEKGVRETLEQGVIAGFPVVDVRCALVFGKYHPVDSSEAAFKTAGSVGFKAGVYAGQSGAARTGHARRGDGAERVRRRHHGRPEHAPRAYPRHDPRRAEHGRRGERAAERDAAGTRPTCGR